MRTGESVDIVQNENRSGMRKLPPQNSLAFYKSNKRRNRGVLEEGGKWQQQACTTMFFLIPKNVTSEKPIALMPT